MQATIEHTAITIGRKETRIPVAFEPVQPAQSEIIELKRPDGYGRQDSIFNRLMLLERGVPFSPLND